jgi:hypothetical protein
MTSEIAKAFYGYLDTRKAEEPVKSFLADFSWPFEERAVTPSRLKVVDSLSGVSPAAGDAERALLDTLAKTAGFLDWRQTYGISDFSQAFLDNYGWVEIFGTRGHFQSDTVAGGFLMLGPHTIYPDHHHIAEEIYIPLTEHSLWSMGGAPFQFRMAGDVIHHPSEIWHAMRTADRPMVALYLWRGGPLDQKSTIVERGIS